MFATIQYNLSKKTKHPTLFGKSFIVVFSFILS